MEAQLQRRVQRYGWDKAATHYEAFWLPLLRRSHDRLLQLARLTPGDRVMDVACGTGIVSLAAARAVGPAGSVLGTDLSGEMVEHARAAAASNGLENATFSRMDAEALNAGDGAFDACLCALGLMYVPEPEAALRQMWRVARPGGRTVVSVWGQRNRCGWAGVFTIVDARVASDVCPLFFRLGTGDALASALREAGFVDIVVERIATHLSFADGDDACGAAFLGGPVALAYSRFDASTRSAVHAEYLASISRYRDGTGYAVPGEFVVAAARKPG